MLNKLKSLLTKKDKQFLLGLLFFSILISIIETVGVSIIMPFITVATDFHVIHTNFYYAYFYSMLDFKSDTLFVITFGIILIVFYIARSLINLLYFYMLNRFTQGRYHLLAYRLFENYMGLSYQDFINKKSSALTNAIINEASNLTSLISAVLFILSEVFIVIFIYSMLLFVNYKITLVLTMILLLNGIFLLKTVSVKIKKAGSIKAEIQKKFYVIINKSFGNFKLIKLQSSDKEVLSDFKDAGYNYSLSNITNATLSHVPRLFLEAFGFGIMVLIITFFVWKYENNISSIFPIISMFILALYRLMPSINRILASYNTILFHHKSLEIIHNDLMYDTESLGNNEIVFEDRIVLNNITFEYEANRPVLTNINLVINKNSKIAFIGESGSGKSTLVDIIIGLYKAQNGTISCDNVAINDSNIRAWRSKVGYIPQTVYLFDGTVADNVAFGNVFDETKIIECLKKAKIYDFLQTKKSIYTLVGEGGVMLSGGQKQRIAIARALYNDPEILILDEATAALDTETESEIMNEIYTSSNNKTLIIIAHRLSTLNQCDKIYELKNGGIIDVQ